MRTFGIFALMVAALVALAQGERLNSPMLHYGHSISKDDPRLGSIPCDACKDVIGFLESRILAKGCDVGTNGTCKVSWAWLASLLVPACSPQIISPPLAPPYHSLVRCHH